MSTPVQSKINMSLYSQPSITMNHVILRYIFTGEKYAYINGPMQFKAMLFKDELRNIIFKSTNSVIRLSG